LEKADIDFTELLVLKVRDGKRGRASSPGKEENQKCNTPWLNQSERSSGRSGRADGA